MTGNYLGQAGIFLIEVTFGLYGIVVLLRFMLTCVRADFYNPLSQLIIRITNPPLIPLRRVIPGYKRIDCASILLLMSVQGIEIMLTTLISTGHVPGAASLTVLIIAYILKTAIYIYIFIILIQIIISWISPTTYNPGTIIMHQLSEPLLKLARNLIPPTGGLDWSPLVVIVILNLMMIMLVAPLLELGRHLF